MRGLLSLFHLHFASSVADFSWTTCLPRRVVHERSTPPSLLLPFSVLHKSCVGELVKQCLLCSTHFNPLRGFGHPAPRAMGQAVSQLERQAHDEFRQAMPVLNAEDGKFAVTAHSRVASASGISILRHADIRSRRKELCQAGSKP
jgi:hypothetical protein